MIVISKGYAGRWQARASSAEFLACDQEQEKRVFSDPFWQKEVEDTLFLPGPADTPVNFAVRVGHEQYMTIPYRVATPMAWEYP